jgi:DnaJ-class molecular chaperone
MYFNFGDGFSSGGRSGRDEPQIEEKDFYEVLGLKKGASDEEIKKAYRKGVRRWHPDRFVDPVEKQAATKNFKEIAEAYDILKDPKKKNIYDRSGVAGLMRRAKVSEEKGENIAFEIQVTLKDMYNGIKKEVGFKKTILCETCDGEGTKDRNSKKNTCTTCDGKGIRLMMRQVGPFMTQSQAKCNNCDGEGIIVSLQDRCTTCKGKKLSKKDHVIEVFVEKGMKNGQKLVYHGEAHQDPNFSPGDVVVLLRENDLSDNKFSRDGLDLIYKKTLSLRQSLTGFQFSLTHLDGRIINISSEEGHIIKPGMRKFIENEGMPQYKNPFKKGRLIIEFDVLYPNDGTFDENIRSQLIKILDHQINLEEKVKEDEENPSHFLKNINEVEEELNRKKNSSKDNNNGSNRDVYNSDEEEQQEEHFGHTTRCNFM